MTSRPARVLSTPTSPKRTHVQPGTLTLARIDVILRTNRQPLQRLLEAPERSQGMREENPVTQHAVRKSSGPYGCRQSARLHQNSIFVERTSVYGVHCERVVRVMLENDQPTARANHAVELFEKVGMFGVRNVIQNACHEYQVETIVRKRELRAVEVHEIGLSSKC